MSGSAATLKMKGITVRMIVNGIAASVMLCLAYPTAAQEGQVAAGIAQPSPGMGQIVFFRRARHADSWWGTCPVTERIGSELQARFKLGGNKFAILQATPGTHEFVTKTETTDRLTLEVEAGETYFVGCELSIGGFARQPADLRPANLEDFIRLAPTLKPAKQQ